MVKAKGRERTNERTNLVASDAADAHQRSELRHLGRSRRERPDRGGDPEGHAGHAQHVA